MLQVKPMSSHQRRAGTRMWHEEVSAPVSARRGRLRARAAPSSRRTRTRRPHRRGARRGCPARPSARSCPDAASGHDSVRRRREAEWIGHPDIPRVGKEDNRVGIVHTQVGVGDLLFVAAERSRRLGGCRGPAVRDHREVHMPANVEVEAVHQCLKCRRPVKIIAAPASDTAAITSSSRFEPPGWMKAAIPASSASLGPSGEREEGIRGEHRAVERVAELACLQDRDPHGVHPTHLPRPDSQRVASTREHDRVRGHVLRDAPCEEKVVPLPAGNLPADDVGILSR